MPFGRGRRGGDDDGKGGTPEQKRRKRARRRNIIIAAFAVFIMVSGIGVVGGTYYVDTVKFTQDELKFPETTQVYYQDGTLLAKLGQTTRYALKLDEMNDTVKDAIVASEDKTFWTNDGRRLHRRHPGRLEQLHRRRHPGRLDHHPAVRPGGLRRCPAPRTPARCARRCSPGRSATS